MKKIKYIFILLLCSSISYAQPGQPETSSFTSAGQTDMVNLSTGSFTYNIPLLEVGGYPINISYQSGISMEQQASMVGLGWNINIGAITRNMRGLPDDFKGDLVKTETTFKKNWTLGVNLGSDLEIFGFKPVIRPKLEPSNVIPPNKNKNVKSKGSLDLTLGVYYNSYTGYGFEWVFSPSISAKKANKYGLTYDLGVGVGGKSDDLATTYSPIVKIKHNGDFLLNNLNIGAVINSISGLKEYSFGLNLNKKDKFSLPVGKSGLINSQSYRPSIPYVFNKSSFTYNAKLGLEGFGMFSNVKTTVYRSSCKLRDSVTNVRAFGYLYLDKSTERDLLDVNREKDMGYIKKAPNLSVPALMNDVFTISGHGISGIFRPFRNDVGILYESRKSEVSGKGNLGTDFGAGFGPNWKVGVKPSFIIQNETSNKWTHNNFMRFDFDFKTNQKNSLYESVYFKNIGEKTIMSNKLLDDLGGYNALKIDLKKLKSSSGTMSWMDGDNIIEKSQFNITHNTERAKREQVFSYLTAQEASINTPTNIIEYVKEDYFINNLDKVNETRINNQRKSHHISHCEVISNDGMRYMYSLPVYNNVYEEVSFNVCDNDLDGNGLVSYTSKENSLQNESGLNNFYEKKSIPPYAHSYLLTAVVTSDYVDVLDDGISDDDLGNFVKFNYFKASDEYKWRFPYEMNQANFNGGFDSKMNDNKGNYLYGEKELVYVQSIESKTQVAIFKYENRLDQYEVLGENGGQGNEAMKKLIEISLYSKRDLIENGADAVPIKTVHFDYNYALLYGHPSHDDDIDYSDYNMKNSDGQLTLKNLYFTYKDHPKSKDNKYVFSYNNDYGYNMKDVDRWGVFKPNNSNPKDLNNTDFPYVIQQENPNDQIKQDKDLYSSQWNLSNIKTLSGGDIKIYYESDDYAFVQDKQAMVMTPLSGVNALNQNILYEKDPYSVLMFKVPKGADKANEHVQDSLVYLRAYVNLFKGYYEYVPCYLEVEKMELDKTSFKGYDVLKLTIKNSTTKDKKGKPINTITKSSIQFAKLHMNDLLTKNINSKLCSDTITQKNEDDLIKWSKDNVGLIGNYYSKRLKQEHAKFINLNKSYARLHNVSYSKLGGGNRVKSIEIHDNWDDLTDGSGNSTFYATDYFYTTNYKGDTISSGVASYEPRIGGDENPFRKPVYYSNNNVGAPDDRYMIEQPIGEIHFPSATVVYSEVTQKVRRNSLDRRYATGRTVSHFYTAKDFPTIISQTSLECRNTPAVSSFAQKAGTTLMNQHVNKSVKKANSKMSKKNSPLLKFSVDNVKVSQGYSVIKNDMHGKPKSIFVYGENQSTALSGVEYLYKMDSENNLDNKFDIIKSDGTISEETIGVDYELYVDMRERKSRVSGLETSFDIDAAFTPVFTAVPTFTIERTSFRSAVFQKVIFQYGLIDSVRVFDNASEITTKNIALDESNTNVLMSRTYNEFGDPIYNTSFPSHWAYPDMGGAYQNILASLDVSTNSDGEVQANNFALRSGDELLITSFNFFTTNTVYDPVVNNKLWVYEFQGKQYLLDINGDLVKSLPWSVAKIIRSAYRNMPSASVAQYKTTDYPNITNLSNNNILDASAIEYSDNWRIERKNRVSDTLSCYPVLYQNSFVNPYQVGIKGTWRSLKSYFYLTDRVSNNSIRTGGAYQSFNPFWKFDSGMLVKSNTSNWKWTSELIDVHANGRYVSTKDPLGRYTSSILGYDNELIVASVSNSKINNAMNLNFESIELECNESPLYRDLTHFTTDNESHTGNSSLMLTQHSKSISQSLDLSASINTTIPYKLQEKDLLDDFKPEAGTYLISVWVKEEHKDYMHKYTSARLKIEIDNQQALIFNSKGPMVEGWQKIEGEFTIDPSCQNIKITFDKNLFQNKVFFDDFRIHPIDASMVSHVYDKKNHFLMADLDENNYAVFYEYDDEGQLIRTKRETERGIMTIQEKRNHVKDD